MNTLSPTPWQLNGTELIDACGNLVGTFKDWKDAEDTMECLQHFQHDGKTAEMLAIELADMERDHDRLGIRCDNLEKEASKLEETNTTLVQKLEAANRENSDLVNREKVLTEKNESLAAELVAARQQIKQALGAV